MSPSKLTSSDLHKAWERVRKPLHLEEVKDALECESESGPSSPESESPKISDETIQNFYIQAKRRNKNRTHTKKQRVKWTPELHERFLAALTILGEKGTNARFSLLIKLILMWDENVDLFSPAFPTRIIQIMNVEGLTREQVSSHLQKYRTTRQFSGPIQTS
ncbi:MAG: hypothetical protein Q8M03_00055, partial [Legionella sp.]|nr:hypothetical protein [Legionella sp.]